MPSARLLIAASAVVVAFGVAPGAGAEPIANCTSDVVEVDYCVGNPNANTFAGVPGVNVGFEFNIGIGLGF